jgi:hypothetical protein
MSYFPTITYLHCNVKVSSYRDTRQIFSFIPYLNNKGHTLQIKIKDTSKFRLSPNKYQFNWTLLKSNSEGEYIDTNHKGTNANANWIEENKKEVFYLINLPIALMEGRYELNIDLARNGTIIEDTPKGIGWFSVKDRDELAFKTLIGFVNIIIGAIVGALVALLFIQFK